MTFFSSDELFLHLVNEYLLIAFLFMPVTSYVLGTQISMFEVQRKGA